MNRAFLYTARAALLLIVLISAIAAWGWISHELLLAQVNPNYVLMQYNTAICMLLCGLAGFGLIEKERFPVLVAMPIVIAIEGCTLLEYILDRDLYVDTLFSIATNPMVIPSRTGLNTALALVLLASVILTCTRRRFAPKLAIFLVLVCSFIFALGAVPLLGYVSGIQEAYRFGTFTRMSLPACLCLILFSSILTLYIGHRAQRLHRWAAVPVFLTLVTISGAAAVAVHVHERQQINQLLQQRVNEQAIDYSGRLHDFYTALNRIGLRWEAAKGTAHALWSKDTESYVHDLPFLKAISRLNKAGELEWITPVEGNERLVGKKITNDPDRAPTIRQAIETRSAHATPPLTLYNNNGLGYVYARPLFINDKYDGMILSVISLPRMLAALAQHRIDEDCYYALEYNGRTLINTLPEDAQELEEWRAAANFTNLNQTYKLVIYPKKEFLKANSSKVAYAVLGMGLLMSTLAALSISFMLRARFHAKLLREAEQFNRTILESANYLIVATDMEGQVLLFNSEAERSLGYKAKEVIGKHKPLLWHDPVEVEEHLDWLRRSTGAEDLVPHDVFTYEALKFGSVEQQWSFVRRDGTRFPGQLTVTPRLSPEGVLLGYLGIIKDMTEQRQQEALLRNSEETFRLAMEHSPIGMALVSLEGRWLNVNKALCEIVGYGREELLVTDFQTLTHPEDLEADMHLVQQVIAGTIRSYTLEKRYYHRQGYEISAMLSVSLVRNDDGSPKYFISMIQDISERKKLIEQLQKTNAELEQFAYVASHDLQEPLRMVTSFVSLLGQQYADKIDDKGKEFIKIAVEASERMRTLISDLLQYARIGRESQVRVDIDCNQEMRHVVQNLDTAIKGTGATVDVGPMPNIRGNPVEFLRLMQNLIGNGIKFHREGVAPVIRVSAKRKSDMWIFTIADNGIGLKQEYYERIFQPFKRLHTQEEYHGSGIGLAVCRKIVENLGGRIWIESVVGQGSTIRFYVPVVKQEEL